MGPDRHRVLVIADGAAPTGYARVSRALLDRLAERWRIEQLLVHHRRDPGGLPWPTHACDLGGDPFGHEKARRLVKDLRPHAILVIYDTVRSGHFVRALAADLGPGAPALVVHTPPEGRYRSPRSVAALSAADRLVSATAAGADWLKEAREQADGTGRSFTLPPVDVVPFGVEVGHFRPPEGGRRAARSRLPGLFGEDAGENAFWILNANQNRPRKRLDLTVEAFARVAARCPEARLCLHTSPRGEPGEGVDLPALAEALGVRDRVRFTAKDRDEHPHLDDETLALLYGACDVGVNTSTVEGWGLIAFEHAATGAPQIVPGHGAVASLWGDSAIHLPAAEQTCGLPFGAVEERTVDSDALVDTLLGLAADPDRRARLGHAARRRALDPELSWDRAAASLGRIVEEAITTRRQIQALPKIAEPRS